MNNLPENIKQITNEDLIKFEKRLHKTLHFANLDAEVFLMLVRKNAEHICYLIFKELISDKQGLMTLNDYINKLKDHISPRAILIIKTIQNYGNFGTHLNNQNEKKEITLSFTETVSIEILKLSKWFYEEFLGIDFVIDEKLVGNVKKQMQNTYKNLNKKVYEAPVINHKIRDRDEIDSFLEKLKNRKSLVVAIEDDAGGIQLTKKIPFIINQEYSNIEWFLEETQKSGIGVLTTPSRSSSSEKAYEYHYEAVYETARSAQEKGMSISWISRGDSCLRGFFVEETQAMKTALRECDINIKLEFFIPGYIQQGRITTNGIQYARLDGKYIPVSETEYSNIPGLEYYTSSLSEFLIEKGSDRVTKKNYVNISIEDLRIKDVNEMIKEISELPKNTVIICDSMIEDDIITLAYIILCIEELNIPVITRSSPSYVVNVNGDKTNDRMPMQYVRDQFPSVKGKGIVVAGSLTKLTKMQIEELKNRDNIATVMVSSHKFWDVNSNMAEKRDTIKKIRDLNKAGFNCLLISDFTISEQDIYPNSEKKDIVLKTYAEILRNVADIAGWIVIKGSDTGFTLLKWGVNQEKMFYLGHIVPGANLCQTPLEEQVMKNIPIVLFQGNSGKTKSLSELVGKLESLES